MSASTLSLSSGSSRGSLASLASSLGSLSLGDQYGACAGDLREADLSELHRRVENILRSAGGSDVTGSQSQLSTIVEMPHAPPTYQQHVERAQLTSSLESKSQPNVSATSSAGARHTSHSHPDLSYIHQYVNEPLDLSADFSHLPRSSDVTNRLAQPPPPSYPSTSPAQQPPLRPSHLPSTQPSPPRAPHAHSLSPLTESSARSSDGDASRAHSVSAGVSDESLAGDSGVFEASAARCELRHVITVYSCVAVVVSHTALMCFRPPQQERAAVTLESAQLQIKLR